MTQEDLKERRRKKAVRRSQLLASKKPRSFNKTHEERLKRYNFKKILFRRFK